MLAAQALSQESNNRQRKGAQCIDAERFVPFTQTHPDLPSDLGHKPSWSCELILVPGKGLATTGVTWYAWQWEQGETRAGTGQLWAGHGSGLFVTL